MADTVEIRLQETETEEGDGVKELMGGKEMC